MDFKFEGIVGENGYVVIQGEISGTTRDELSEYLQVVMTAIKGKSIKNVYVDIAGVDYVDSIGIALLLQFQREIKENKAQLCLIKAVPSVKKVFNMLNLGTVFNFYENEGA